MHLQNSLVIPAFIVGNPEKDILTLTSPRRMNSLTMKTIWAKQIIISDWCYIGFNQVVMSSIV